jgi:hypothetical protein
MVTATLALLAALSSTPSVGPAGRRSAGESDSRSMPGDVPDSDEAEGKPAPVQSGRRNHVDQEKTNSHLRKVLHNNAEARRATVPYARLIDLGGWSPYGFG